MKVNIFHIPTNTAQVARKSKRSIFSIARRRTQRVAGLGIASALNAVVLIAGTTVRVQKNYAMRDSGNGGKKILSPLGLSIKDGTLSRNMACHHNRLRRCVSTKTEGAPFANAERPDFSWTIAIPRGTSGHCFAKPAIRSLDGTKRRPTLSFGSNATSMLIADNAPCHADVLLEVANRPVCEAVA